MENDSLKAIKFNYLKVQHIFIVPIVKRNKLESRKGTNKWS